MKHLDSLYSLVYALCSAGGVSGKETGSCEAVCRILDDEEHTVVDTQGSVLYSLYRHPDKNAPHLMLEAHLDEIGMMISRVREDGFLEVCACGGLDRHLLMGLQVLIHAKNAPAPIPGVLGCTQSRDKVPQLSDLFIDTGLTGEEAKALIVPGDRVTVVAPCHRLLNNQVSSKALDDRAGCAIILRAGELLKGEELPCSVSLCFSVQEETGGVGARTASYRLNPTHACAVDVSFAFTPDSPRNACGDMGGGAMIGTAPILDNESTELLRQMAIKYDLPYQMEVMGAHTGTDADSIAPTRSGIKTTILSVPLKYMHTPIEVIDLEDIEVCAQLLAQFARHLGKAPEKEDCCRG